MGDARETSARYIFDKLAHEGIDTRHIVHMPGLVTPISNIMIDPSGERTIVTFRDPELWKVRLPDANRLLEDCDAILTENRCAEFCTDLCAEARRRGIPVIVDVDRAMSLPEGLLTASSHLVSPAKRCNPPPAWRRRRCLAENRETDPSFLAGHRVRSARYGSTKTGRCNRRRRSPSIPWIRWARATYSMARSP